MEKDGSVLVQCVYRKAYWHGVGTIKHRAYWLGGGWWTLSTTLVAK